MVRHLSDAATAEPPWGAEVLAWVQAQGPFVPDLVGFAAALGRRLRGAGMPVLRLAFNVQLLHPRYQASTVHWRAKGDRAGRVDWPRTIHETATFKSSPMAAVIGRGEELRYRLDEAEARHPIDHDFRELGATEYFGLPLHGPTALPHALSVAVGGAGLTDAQVEGLRALAAPLGEVCDARTLMETARSVADLWVDHHTWRGRNPLRDGDAQHLRGAFLELWWANFDDHALESPPDAAIARLNHWYEIVSRMVHRREGEVLETAGSRVLAYFPSATPNQDMAACTRAVDAARTTRAAAFDLGELERTPPRLPDVRAAVDLDSAVYGPVGGDTYLHFAIAGPVRGRLEALLRKTEQVPVVVSAPVAGRLGGGRDLGGEGIEAFSLSADPDADTLL